MASQSSFTQSRPAYPQYRNANSNSPASAFQNSASSSMSSVSSSSQSSLPRLAPPQRQNSDSGPLPSPLAQQQQYGSIQQSQTYNYQPNRTGAGQTAAETGAYLSQYNLVAEAAKRAQMAVLERDLGGMEM